MRYASITERLAGLGSGKWDIHLRGRKLAAEGKPVIELTIGEPDIPPDDRLLDVCNAAMRAGRTRYSNGRGEPELLAALAAKYSQRSGRKVTPENVLVVTGTQTALYAAMMALVGPGDKVLIPDPYYATYEAVVRAPGAELVPVPLDPARGFHLTAAALEAATAAMRGDEVFRDAVHHFLRLFDRSVTEMMPQLSDDEILWLAETRSARAFMLLARAAGLFGQDE